jgi:hypothetical protein
MHIPIQHIIGTVALIGLVISASLAFNVISSFITEDIVEQQLSQVSDLVALNLVEVVNLINFANSGEMYQRNNTIVKAVSLPLDAGGKAYTVTLTRTNGEGYSVASNLVTQNTTSATSLIPVNSTTSSLQIITEPITMTYNGEQENWVVTSKSLIYGGNGNIVVWAWKPNATTYAGIGTINMT